ncbi:MAG: cation-translocating P-type ATPase [Candidatus Bathyarchaeia archaeon]
MSAQESSALQRDLKYHALEAGEALRALQTSLGGLEEEEASRRLEVFGPNELREEKRVTPLGIFLNQFKSVLVIILLFSAFISAFLLEEYLDTYLILIIVIMNAILGFVQEYRAEKALEALKRMVSPTARVVRDGRERELPASELVPGDIIILEEGGRIPVDARLLEVVSLRVDEAPLTGESVPVEKRTLVLQEEVPIAEKSNMVFMGTSVAYGRGKAAATATGMNTEFGKIAAMMQAVEEEEPPLKKKVEHLGRQLGAVSLAFCVFIFLIGLLAKMDLVFMFMTSVSMAVSAIPEGLPAVITITLALGVSRMAKQRSIVRKLASVETLGCTTVICSDKTGTLTRNEMMVTKLSVNGQTIDVTGSGYEPKGDFLQDNVRIVAQDDNHTTLLLRIASLCNNARLEEGGEGWQILGDPTEGALVVAAAKAGMWQDKTEGQYPRIGEIPFSSMRKRMSTIHISPGGERVAYVKGAPEIILGLSDRIYENGRVRELNEEDVEQISEVTERMAGEGLRLLAMSYKELSDTSQDFESESVESQLIFVGLVGMIDPPRKEVPEAIKLCRQAGIKSIMITGDHKLTAVAIAKQIGLLEAEDGPRALIGSELDKLSDEELVKIVDETLVYARVSPEHKMRIAQLLKRKGHVVAMTGDGVNDAPAIKTADIGVAMGIKGTDVTKEASDMILEDDNFATIVSAVEGGRHIFDNIKKYLRLLITTNFDEFFEITFCSLAGFPLTLLPIQILWVNLITDGLPAVALSIDPKEPDVMQRPPRDPKKGFLRPMWRFLIFVATLDFVTDIIPFLYVLTAGFTFWGPWAKDNSLLLLARAENFTSLVFFEVFLALSCRSERHSIIGQGWRGITANKMLFYSLIGSAILQLVILYTPLAGVFHIAPLPPFWLAVAVIDSLSALLIFPQKLLGEEVRAKDVALICFFEAGSIMTILSCLLHQSISNPLFWIGVIIILLSAREMYI